MPTKHDWVPRLSEELFADPSALARLRGRPLADLPSHCWLTPTTQVRVTGGNRLSVRYAVFTYITGRELDRDRTLIQSAACVPGCCNPMHQVVAARPRTGRKPVAPADRQEPASALDLKTWQFGLEWPDLDLYSRLIAMPADRWPEEARTRCWNWTGYTTVFQDGHHQRRMPRLGQEAAHAVIWSIHNRTPVTEQMRFRRACRNPICVNPHHVTVKGRPAVTAVTAKPATKPVTSTPEPAPLLTMPAGLTVTEAGEDIEYWWEAVQTPTIEGFLSFLAARPELLPYRSVALQKGGPFAAICEALGWR